MDDETPKLNLPAYVSGVRAELRALLAALDRISARIEQIERELSDFAKALRVDAPLHDPPANGADPPVTVSYFGHVWLDNGKLKVQINGTSFLLAHQVGEVLVFLATGSGKTDDSLASWRSRQEVAAHLQTKSKTTIRVGYVNTLIDRLRNALRDAGLDQRLIQSNRREGVRLAVKRLGANVIGSVGG